MMERSSHNKMIDKNWATKRKRKRLPCGQDPCNGKESRLNIDSTSTRSSRKKKGNDGYYYECVVCDRGGNLLCCDSCPRTYHLQCLSPPLKRTPPGKWQCPTCYEQSGCLRSIVNSESPSKEKQTKITFKSYKSESSSPGSNKASGIVQNCIPGKNTSSCGEKPAPSLKIVFVQKKSDSSQTDASHGLNSNQASHGKSIEDIPHEDVKVEEKSNLACVDTSGNKKSNSPIKEPHCSGEILECSSIDGFMERKPDPPCNNEVVAEKFSSPPGCATKKPKKRKQSKGTEVIKKKSKDMRKSSLKSADRHGKLLHPSPKNSKSLKKGNDHRVSTSPSKENLGEKSSAIQQTDTNCLEEMLHSSNESDEMGVALNGKTTEESAVVEYHQVDRILGCRARSIAISSSINPVGCKRDVDVKDVECSQDDLNEDKGGKSIKNNTKEDKLHVYRRSSAKRSKQGDSRDSTGIYLHDSLSLNAAILNEAVEKIDDLQEVTEKLVVPVEKNDVQHAPLGSDGDCSTVGTSETSFPCDKNTNNMQSDMGPNNNAETNGEPNSEELVPLYRETTRFEFLVKWMGKSHIHNSWVSEAQLKVLAKRKLENYKSKYGMTVLNICREEWCQPQRVIALRSPKDATVEAFVKWSCLPYDECTWERIDEPAIEKCSHLIAEFKQFEQQTLDNDSLKSDLMKGKHESQPSEIVPLLEQPKELKGGLLFQHQLEALNWLRKCWHRSKNVILADEMGLGKTVSACAFLSSLYVEFKARLPCLVLVPLSTMPNWLSEFALWAPNLNVVEYHGCARARSMIRLYEWHASYPDGSNKRTESYKFNVLLTTYEMILADSSHLRGVPWEVLIVDEGHRLKNSGSKLFSLLNSFSFQHRVLLTGTPLQNNIGEMYNLLNFLQPASFPSLSSFEEKFNDLTTAEKVDELKKLVAPHMLRRLKKDVMQNIPPKTERMVPVELSSIQAEYYRAMLTKNYQILRNIGKGVAQQSMLNIVMQLRKVCNHPYLIPGTEPDSGSFDFLHEMRIKASAKLTLLHSMLKLLHKEGHRVLIFSQMTKLLDILEDYLNIEYGPKAFERVDGSVSVAERQAAIARFNHDKSRFVFLLSTRSCGLGINLATADTVIIYDSDFNPHADIQAMNRAHRIGQSNRLLVYRLVVRASVEERILQLAKKKLMLDQLFVNKSGSQKEVEDILRWGTEELFSDPSSETGKDKAENSSSIDETITETESKHRRRLGGLGDVYKDKCTDGNTKIFWDETAILKLLDRSILQSVQPEGADGDSETDMLGTVKSLEWNDDPVEEPTELPPPAAEEVNAQDTEKKEDHVPECTEENEWDRLLRLRWEKYQSEEEAALGRGKRLRKAVSYNDAFAPHPIETPTGPSANEEEVPEREYTPAGRALKAKFSKLRARQKERLAKRNTVLGSDSIEGRFGSEPQPRHEHDKAEGEMEPVDLVREQQMEDRKSKHPVDAPAYNSDSFVENVTGVRHNKKSNFSSHLDLSVRPLGSSTSGILVQNCPSQGTSYASSVLASNLLPVLGLCAPNANQLDSGHRKKHEADVPAGPNSGQSRKGKRLLDFPFRLDPGAGTSGDMELPPQSGGDTSNVPDTPSEVPPQRSQSSILESIFSFSSYPFINTQGRGPNLYESSSSAFPSFQDRMAPPKVTFEENRRSIFPSGNNVPKTFSDLLPNLSLGTGVESTVQDLPTRPFLPDLRLFPQDMPKLDRRGEEVPSMLSLGPLHGTNYPLPESHKKVLDNISMRTGPGMLNSFKKRSKLNDWSEDELDALWIGVRRYGRGNWDAMLKDRKLKFSRYKTFEDLCARWEEEQAKFFDESAPAASKSVKSTPFSAISDGMMARALHGSGLSGIGDYFAIPKSQNHSTDMRLGYGHPLPGMLPVDPSTSRSERATPLPAWKPDEFQSHFRRDFSTVLNRPSTSNFHLEHPLFLSSMPNLSSMGLHHSSKSDLEQKEDEHGGYKFAKLPTRLDSSLSWAYDSHSMHSSQATCSKLFPTPSKQPNVSHPTVKDDAPVSDSPMNKLPHWLREAVSSPAIPPEPVLPPNVSAIAHSVRLLYGAQKPTIPPFTVPGPPPSLPEDPRRSLKKKGKLHKLRRESPDVGTTSKLFERSLLGDSIASGSTPSAPPLPASGFTWIENNLPTMNSQSESSRPNHHTNPVIGMSPSPEVLKFVATCVPPNPQALSVPATVDPTSLGSQMHLLETSEDGNEQNPVEPKNKGKEKAGQSLQMGGGCGKLPEERNGRSQSGDSSKTHSDHPQDDQSKVKETSSEETVSDNHRNDPESDDCTSGPELNA